MEIYNSEEEQVEALRRWWQQNGRSVLTALAVVLLAVVGWQTWTGHQRTQAEQASMLYEQMLGALEETPELAAEQGRAIIAQFPSSTYADYASLTLARIAVEAEDLEQAAAQLQRVVDNGNQTEVRELARLRLGQVRLAQGQPDDALSLIRGQAAGSLRPAFEELKGDVLLAQGEPDAARNAYGNALAGYDSPAKQQIVQMKLDDLAAAQAKATGAAGDSAE